MLFLTTTRTSSVRCILVPLLLVDATAADDSLSVDALSHGELWRLDMGSLTAANSTALAWVDVQQAPYPSGYQPVMALAENHVFFLNVGGTAAGSADIFVIHCTSVLKLSFCWTLT